MSALAKLRMVTSNQSTSKPYHGFTKLSVGYHKIECFRLVKNKFTKDATDDQKKTILVELENEIVFLPQYFMNVLDKDDLNNLNCADEINYLYFGGKREKNK